MSSINFRLLNQNTLKRYSWDFCIIMGYCYILCTIKTFHRFCNLSSIPSMLLMVQRNPPHAVWYHLVLSWCTMVSEVKRQGVQESKNIDYAKHHTPLCWLPAKVMYPTNSTKRFSWLTRSTSILLIKNVQIYPMMVFVNLRLKCQHLYHHTNFVYTQCLCHRIIWLWKWLMYFYSNRWKFSRQHHFIHCRVQK